MDTYTICSPDGASQATFVPDYGGTLSSLIMSGVGGPRELLYQHDYFWQLQQEDLPGGLPFIFPVFARLERQGERGAYLYDGRIYRLPMHGFSWQEPWEVEQRTASRIVLQLRDNERTRQHYPFHFEITLEYEIQPQRLLCYQQYTNRGVKPMPYSAAFHPYFLTPPSGQGKERVQLNYSPTRCLLYNSTLTDLVGEGPLPRLPSSVMDPRLNEQLTEVRGSKEVLLSYPEGDVLHFCAQGLDEADLFPYLQLYTRPEKPYFCAEPLMSPPNAMNSVCGMRWLAPGQSERGLFTLWLNNFNALQAAS